MTKLRQLMAELCNILDRLPPDNAEAGRHGQRVLLKDVVESVDDHAPRIQDAGRIWRRASISPKTVITTLGEDWQAIEADEAACGMVSFYNPKTYAEAPPHGIEGTERGGEGDSGRFATCDSGPRRRRCCGCAPMSQNCRTSCNHLPPSRHLPQRIRKVISATPRPPAGLNQ